MIEKIIQFSEGRTQSAKRKNRACMEEKNQNIELVDEASSDYKIFVSDDIKNKLI